jgi:hypothetical protein
VGEVNLENRALKAVRAKSGESADAAEGGLVMQVEVGLSQRRACGLMEQVRRTCRYRRRRVEEPRLRVDCVNWLKREEGSVTGGCRRVSMGASEMSA